nr:MAG TPA: hypothetical protein [Podoviridae sp. ctY3D12]
MKAVLLLCINSYWFLRLIKNYLTMLRLLVN